MSDLSLKPTENLQHRVKKKNRCPEYGYSNGTRVRCTRKENHEGKHICQIQTGAILHKWR